MLKVGDTLELGRFGTGTITSLVECDALKEIVMIDLSTQPGKPVRYTYCATPQELKDDGIDDKIAKQETKIRKRKAKQSQTRNIQPEEV